MTDLMKLFTIRDLERFSGIRAHTLRTWELRYNLPKPQRSEGNSRTYSLAELQTILHLAILNRNGYRISQLSAFSPATIESKIQALPGEDNRQLKAVADLLVYMYSLDIPAFEGVLNDCFSTMPLQSVLQHIVYSFLVKTNLFWQGNRLAEEHLVVTAIRKKIILAIENTDTPALREKTVLLFLDGNRQLDLALLYTNYILKSLGVQVIYLGNDISVPNLEVILNIHKPDLLYTYMSKCSHCYLHQLGSLISERLPGARLIVSQQSETILRPHSAQNVVFLDYESALQLLSA